MAGVRYAVGRGACWLVLGLVACTGKLDERGFRRKAEAVFAETHPGWTVFRREEDKTVYVRGDQLDDLDVATLFDRYEKDPKGFFDTWRSELEAELAARHRTLEQAKSQIIPVIKGEAWIHAQDLGAIGPERIRDAIRPWRKEVADGVYVVLGVPEEKLGYRYASIQEVREAEGTDWYAQSVTNLERDLLDSGEGAELETPEGSLLALDMPNEDGISGLVLSEEFRKKILKRFNKQAVGAAIPIRKVLIVFDPDRGTATKPVRARAHELYDSQNHPGFRGLLRLEAERITVMEPARPKKGRP